jgi:hypothetical protein
MSSSIGKYVANHGAGSGSADVASQRFYRKARNARFWFFFGQAVTAPFQIHNFGEESHAPQNVHHHQTSILAGCFSSGAIMARHGVPGNISPRSLQRRCTRSARRASRAPSRS